ncbi:hypothetical protein QTO34_018880 [Cnephaeus nilssonii]|uniref:Interferon alpha-inducible protein 6 n=1 Tax=Cnephaeus nilssonii TaxID=3371016 RepID=A0AA40HZM4_CNENI|nr:hypothetical protein QTO34_018880 [Eptesicus nilssonii]
MIKSQPAAWKSCTSLLLHLSTGSGQEDSFSSLLQGPATKPARAATMRQKVVSLLLCYLLLSACGLVEAGKRKDSEDRDSGSGVWGALTYMASEEVGLEGGSLTRWAGPSPGRSLTVSSSPGVLALGLPALGFTSTGIAANSVAASLMSWSAVSERGRRAAGGLVATLQSLGATGGSTLMAKVGAILGYTVHRQIDNKGAKEEEEE